MLVGLGKAGLGGGIRPDLMFLCLLSVEIQQHILCTLSCMYVPGLRNQFMELDTRI